MSIFKETIADTIQTQLQARTNVISGKDNNRSELLPWYLSKNSWVRMTSMVNFTSGKADFADKTGKVSVIPDGKWTNEQLSQRYVLEGGTLYTKKNGSDIESTLRSNIASLDGAYGGNFDVNGNGKADEEYSRQLGIRPMPGITSVNLSTVTAYGSIFETTVKFYAWDTKQLNDLEILFMRPGYSVLLEWGWSQYIDYSKTNEKLKDKLTKNDIYPTVFDGITFNPFINYTQQEIYDKLETLRIKYKHNYDGMLGYVKNFSWKMMTNGGYECTTTLISMGEVINSLKISTNTSVLNNKEDWELDSQNKPMYDDFEKIFISFKVAVEPKTKYTGSIEKPVDPYWTIDEDNEYYGTFSYDEDYVTRKSIVDNLKKNKYTKEAERLLTQPIAKRLQTGTEEKPEGDYFEYISLDVVMAIMDSYFNFLSKSKSGKITKIVKIIPPSDSDYCLAGKDSVSVDPSVCLVSNRLSFENELIEELNPYYPGVNPPIYKVKRNEENQTLYLPSDVEEMDQFYDATNRVGLTKNIYVNVNLLLSEYKSIKSNSGDSGVNFIIFIKNVLNKISNALGGLNNFIVSTAGRDQNTLRIVDTYYLERGGSKYEFDLLGLGSICRHVDVTSQIFENQSTIVAIAAQSRANLGDIYNSTQVYLNAGMEDRVMVEKYAPGDEEDSTAAGTTQSNFYRKLWDFLIYLKYQVIGKEDNERTYPIETNPPGIPYTFLKEFLIKYNGEVGFKALLPFKLSIKLDGIGGIVIGQIFRVRQNVIPRNYYDKNLGFIITKISHELNKNDWETTLETQVCLLDQYTLGPKFLENVSRKGFKEFVKRLKLRWMLYQMAKEFAEFQAMRAMTYYLQLQLTNALSGGQNISLTEAYERGFGINPQKFFTAEELSDKKITFETYFSSSIIKKVLENKVPLAYSYNIKEFKAFAEDWLIAYEKQEADFLNNTPELKEGITLLKNIAGGKATDEEFTPLFDEISSFFSSDKFEENYVPGNKGIFNLNSFPITNTEEGLSFFEKIKSAFQGDFIIPATSYVSGLNLPLLESNIDSYLQTNDTLRNLSGDYNRIDKSEISGKFANHLVFESITPAFGKQITAGLGLTLSGVGGIIGGLGGFGIDTTKKINMAQHNFFLQRISKVDNKAIYKFTLDYT